MLRSLCTEGRAEARCESGRTEILEVLKKSNEKVRLQGLAEKISSYFQSVNPLRQSNLQTEMLKYLKRTSPELSVEEKQHGKKELRRFTKKT